MYYFGGICFITDRACCALSVYDMTEAALKAGIRFIQYRDKENTRRGIYDEAVRLRDLTRRFGATLIINDHADIALAVDADGVHLGQDDLPLASARRIMGAGIIGISTHDLAQAREAEASGADYIGFGPVFETRTKDAGTPKGTDILADIAGTIKIPVVAIGGINVDNISSVFRAGASAAALASAVCRGDVTRNAERLVSEINRTIPGGLR